MWQTTVSVRGADMERLIQIAYGSVLQSVPDFCVFPQCRLSFCLWWARVCHQKHVHKSLHKAYVLTARPAMALEWLWVCLVHCEFFKKKNWREPQTHCCTIGRAEGWGRVKPTSNKFVILNAVLSKDVDAPSWCNEGDMVSPRDLCRMHMDLINLTLQCWWNDGPGHVSFLMLSHSTL